MSSKVRLDLSFEQNLRQSLGPNSISIFDHPEPLLTRTITVYTDNVICVNYYHYFKRFRPCFPILHYILCPIVKLINFIGRILLRLYRIIDFSQLSISWQSASDWLILKWCAFQLILYLTWLMSPPPISHRMLIVVITDVIFVLLVGMPSARCEGTILYIIDNYRFI